VDHRQGGHRAAGRGLTELAANTSAARAAPLTRDSVIEAALRLVETQGVHGLSMRRLAGELGVAVTAIYWHVGNREALLDELVDRIMGEIGAIRPMGRTPEQRIMSIARSLRGKLLDRPHLVGLAHQQGRTATMLQPAQAAVARELAVLGLRGAKAAQMVQAVLFHVIGSVVLERSAERAPTNAGTNPDAWRRGSGDVDDELVERLAQPADHDEVFELALKGLVTSLIGGRTAT
jgi:TetR/AcrR family tetracycline transcriptional repressor